MKNFFSYHFKIKPHIICAGILLFLTCPGYSQHIYNETTFYIPGGIEVHAPANFNNTGFIQNNGSIALTGDWNNTNVYQGTGFILLEGTDQSMDNNNLPIENLIINGGGTKTLYGKLHINSSVDFSNGIFLVQDNDTLSMSANATVQGGSSISYVDGAMIAHGNGYKYFPIGKNGKYHPVELLDVKGLNPEIEMEVFENLPLVQTSLPTTLYQDIYWTRKTISGTFENTPIALSYAIPDPINLLRLVIAKGESLSTQFALEDGVEVRSTVDFNIIVSRRAVTGNVFAVGELINDPPQPYYFSTTLSPEASNPENRTVKIFGDDENPSDFNFQVFNRWGLPIYETKSYATMSTEGWDGKQSGSLLPSGLYPYSLKYIDGSGKTIQSKGFITMIR